MVRAKRSPTAPKHKDPVVKKTTQGAGKRSRVKAGKKKNRGQGR